LKLTNYFLAKKKNYDVVTSGDIKINMHILQEHKNTKKKHNTAAAPVVIEQKVLSLIHAWKLFLQQ